MSEGTDTAGVDPELVAKVASHDRDIVNLTDTVQSLAETMQSTADSQWRAIREQGETLRSTIHEQGTETRKDLSVLSSKLSESRAVNWPLLVTTAVVGLAFTSLAVTVMAMIGSMALEPISSRLDKHIATTSPERTTEIDYRLRSVKEQYNLGQQHQFMLLNLTRRESGLEPLDSPTYWPAVKGGD